MLKGFKNLVHRNGNDERDSELSDRCAHEQGADGRGTNGHGRNGHGTNGHGANGHGANGDDALDVSPAPATSIKVPDGFRWTLEVRQDQHILGSMHSSNPFVLISFFRDYSMLYGEPVESYAVWLRYKDSNRGAPMQYQLGHAAWIDFLRKLDPEIDENLEATRSTRDRTSMLDSGGRPTHPDAVLERAFGLVRKSA